MEQKLFRLAPLFSDDKIFKGSHWHDTDWSSESFKTINHEIILGKLYDSGFSAEAITWSKSYLSDWTSPKNIDNCLPNLSKFLCTIPLRSDLDELLFLLYVNGTSQAA